MTQYKNIIIVSGTGRNVGKTTFVCDLISKFKEQEVIGLKICPYLHNIESVENLLLSNDNFQILRETNLDGNKDTSRMLKNGAKEVFYIQAIDEGILAAFNFLMENFLGNRPVICESAALGKNIQPGIIFCVTNPETNNKTNKNNNIDFDCIVWNNMDGFDFDFNRVSFVRKEWVLL
ncbi:MAG: hypothetical protein HXX09_10620 [Bacteroidetes bacterium]|nr:hypothetical protein [Bacteroidota bacterium]